MAKTYLDNVPIIGALNRNLTGASDNVLTFALLALGLVAIISAFIAPPVLKATMLAWFIFP